MNPNYETMFENLQNMKANLFNQDKLKNYYEDDTHFYIKTKNTDDVKLRKNKYRYKLKIVDMLIKEIQKLNKRIISMQKIYVLSRVNKYENELEDLFKLRNEKLTKLEILNQSIISFPDMLFELENGNVINIPLKKSIEKPIEQSKSEIKQKQKIKKYLFETYKQCISQKTSEPTYMTKESIIKHIKEHDPGLLKLMPKNITAMKKGEICKVLFKID